ncbi:MAG: hypothetical protein LBR06_02300 [Bacteroidales bacterium]|jgi:ABC-type phosphate transport system substrate-binding protein|nr:hypothetical protein [Bacteroidales bacterium]
MKNLFCSSVERLSRKKALAVAFLASGMLSGSVVAVGQPSVREVVRVKSVRAMTPLVEKWIEEYGKVNPDVQIRLADNDIPASETDIILQIAAPDADSAPDNQVLFTTGRYAILPIAGADNAVLEAVGKKKLNMKQLKALYFERDIFDEESGEEEEPDSGQPAVTVYSGNNEGSVSQPFAAHFGKEQVNLRGKKIAGDDLFLINAIQKDPSGVSFNNLSYIFDTQSRRLKTGITILPLDLKKEYEEVIRQSDLDRVIALLESKTIDLIPVKDISFVMKDDATSAAQHFLQWVITNGQEYNHAFGFLTIDAKLREKQQQQLASKFRKPLLVRHEK